MSDMLPPKVVSGGQPKSAAKKRQTSCVSMFVAKAAPISNNANAAIPEYLSAIQNTAYMATRTPYR